MVKHTIEGPVSRVPVQPPDCSKAVGLLDFYILASTNNEHPHIIHMVCSSLWWRHNDHDSVSNHQPHECLLNRLFGRRSKKTSKLRVTGLCVGNSPGPVNSPHKGPVTRKMIPFDDVIMLLLLSMVWRHTFPAVHFMTTSMALWESDDYTIVNTTTLMNMNIKSICIHKNSPYFQIEIKQTYTS